jgi:hypothetical protein
MLTVTTPSLDMTEAPKGKRKKSYHFGSRTHVGAGLKPART